MKLFESVKAAVTLRRAAETYGLRVLPNGMTCCPFHEDRHPSLKLNEDYFFCFGCGASGDVIDFTARLFGISLKDAAEKLAADFSINPRPPEQSEIPNCHPSGPSPSFESVCDVNSAARVLQVAMLHKPGRLFLLLSAV